MSRKVGSIVLVLVLALWTAGAAHASPSDREAPAAGGLLQAMSRLLEWAGLMPDSGRLIPVWSWDGSHLDPNGEP
ncbi:MAG TPA: hypothetical protein VJ885_05525 [Thermoanaerobaculia bacterium]|nr:hypothetical protein [Thermoanaerobaculia bacterium]